MPARKQAKKGTKPTHKDIEPKWPGDVSDDMDYDSGLESDSSGSSFNRESIASGNLHVVARKGVITDDEEGGGAGDARDSITPSNLDLVAQEGVAADEEEGDITGEARCNVELTDEQASMLQRHVGAFQAADPEFQLKIIQVSVDHMKSSWQQSVGFNRDHVEMFVRRYLYNRCRRERKRLKFQHRNWMFNDILVDAHRKEIDKMAVEISGSRPGSAAYLGCYKKAIKIINERLDEETWVKYRAEAKKWTEQRPPHGQQQWMFEKHGINTMWEFSESMYRQYGVQAAILGGYSMTSITSWAELSFKARYKDWQRDPMVEDFSKWTAESFGADPNNDIEEEGQRKDAAPIIKLVTDKKGYPMLPSWEAIEDKGLMYKKYLIGKFMKITIGGGKGRVPWARLKEAQGDFILAKYLPAGVTLTQYHHLCLEDTNALLKHWTQRQAASKIPFCFKKLDKANGYEGSLGDIHGHQEQESDKETPGDIGSSTKLGA
ncbi:hypothetical protein BJY52DRAFT_1195315 [Lactarius psammicola]|nr:hypothetical protein BJY52DRAFT_1195315 [Lactarius psammicola]